MLRMEIKTEPITKPSHGFALLKELDIQRRTGTFCDCVIRLHLHPDQLFLAHKSVLAAFSPVLASLLPHHGSFMDLNSPLLTPETLTLLLEYMYTGTLPPKSHDEAVWYAAFYLQMEQLQHELTCRRTEKEITHNAQHQHNRNRELTDHKSLDKTLLSPTSCFSHGSEHPTPSTPSYEVVPVICHPKTTGNNKPPTQTDCLNETLDNEQSPHVSEDNDRPQRSRDLLLFGSKSETENSGNDTFSDVAEDDEEINSCCKIRQFQSSGLQTIADLLSDTDNRAYTNSKHLNPESPDCRLSDKKYISATEDVKPVNTYESEKHVNGFISDLVRDRNSHAFSQNMMERQTGTNTTCEKRTSDIKTDLYYTPTSKPDEKAAVDEKSQNRNITTDFCGFSDLKQDTNAYQGHLRYHYLPDSNDSESDADLKDSSEVLETADMAEILLSARKQLKSGSHTRFTAHRFRCAVPECQKAFSQRGSLNRHMRSHLGIRPYPCPICTMTFSRQYRVNEHMRVHQRSWDEPS